MTTVHISWKTRAQKAEGALEKIRQYKLILDSCPCKNPSDHASCLAGFAELVEEKLQEVKTR